MSTTSRPYVLGVRLSTDERALVERRAQRAGLTASEYARRRVLAADSPQEVESYTLMHERLAGVEDAVKQARRVLSGSQTRRKAK